MLALKMRNALYIMKLVLQSGDFNWMLCRKPVLINTVYFRHPSPTTIPHWIYRFSSDHRSQAVSGPVSTWMGDRLGIPGVVGFCQFCQNNTWKYQILPKKYTISSQKVQNSSKILAIYFRFSAKIHRKVAKLRVIFFFFSSAVENVIYYYLSIVFLEIYRILCLRDCYHDCREIVFVISMQCLT